MGWRCGWNGDVGGMGMWVRWRCGWDGDVGEMEMWDEFKWWKRVVVGWEC